MMAIKRAQRPQPPAYVAPADDRADPARARAMIAEAWKILSRKPARPARTTEQLWRAVTAGHDLECVCEVCFPKRGRRIERVPGGDDE